MSSSETNWALPQRKYSGATLLLVEQAGIPLLSHTITKGVFAIRGGDLRTAGKRRARECQQLVADGLLTQHAGPTFGGSPPAYYRITKKGQLALVGLGLRTKEELRRRKSNRSVRYELTRHRQLTMAVYAEVLFACRAVPALQVLEAFHDGELELRSDSACVVPDLAVVFASGTQRLTVFFEIQGTAASLTEGVLKKLWGYYSYLRGEEARKRFGGNFRVAFVTFSDDRQGLGRSRRNNVAETAGTMNFDTSWVYVSAMADLREQGLLAATWLRPEQVKRLGENPRQLSAIQNQTNAVRAARDAAIENQVRLCRLFD